MQYGAKSTSALQARRSRGLNLRWVMKVATMKKMPQRQYDPYMESRVLRMTRYSNCMIAVGCRRHRRLVAGGKEVGKEMRAGSGRADEGR